MMELLDLVKSRKLAYYSHTISKQGSCPEREIMQETMPVARRRGRPRLDGQHQDVSRTSCGRVCQNDRGQR